MFIQIDQINEEGEEDEVDTGEMTEMRFVPDDKGQLDAMYLAMTYCQSQHPPDDVLSEGMCIHKYFPT